jgi:hypothetical protein
MLTDFTLAAFDAFCQHAVPVFTLADYLAQPAPPAPPFVILRVDVDYREDRAVDLARIAAHHHARGSFYFRCHRGGFVLEAIRQIAALGHEVGYHFETLDLCRGDFDAASDLFLQHIDRLRRAGVEVRTVAAHSALPVTTTYRANLDLLRQRPDLLNRAGLSGETTLSIDFDRVVYVSDARWRWRCYEHYRPGVQGQPTSLRVVQETFRRWPAGLYINFHPQQWFARAVPMHYFRLRQRIGRRVRPLLVRAGG